MGIKNNIRSMTGQAVRMIGRIIYPSCCPFCGRLTENDREICEACRKKLREPEEPLCRRCGKPIPRPEEEYCHDCREREAAFVCGRSLWLHKSPVSDAVYRFKYHNCRCYADAFAWEMWQRFEWQIYRWKIDVIMPVPIHRSRRRQRGYNQAELLSRKLSEFSGITSDEEFLIRKKKTDAQKNVSGKERRKNMQSAFSCQKNGKHYRNVLVVDDIYTTGSTLQAVSECLKEAGVKNVYFITISIGQGF